MNFKRFMSEKYDARVEASPNYQWYQKVMNAGLYREAGVLLDNIKTGAISFLPVAITDEGKTPMIGGDIDGRYNGRGKFDEALSVIAKNGKRPGYAGADFEVVILVGRENKPLVALDLEGNVKDEAAESGEV